ncbi:MAG: hypothetical protein USCAAHI_02743 [Beijerinckiaceae bacterium]|nr:MAG: hypothetical protein USCAAHI_02743 [Beijerinckiaceae bacterium]
MRRLMIIAAAVASLAGSAEIGGSAQAGSPLKHGLATKITKRRGRLNRCMANSFTKRLPCLFLPRFARTLTRRRRGGLRSYRGRPV